MAISRAAASSVPFQYEQIALVTGRLGSSA